MGDKGKAVLPLSFAIVLLEFPKCLTLHRQQDWLGKLALRAGMSRDTAGHNSRLLATQGERDGRRQL